MAAPLAELGARQAGAGQQHFMRTCKRAGNLGKEGAVVIGLALVLVVAARLDPLGLHMLAVKHHHMGFGMIHPDNGVKTAHAFAFLRWVKI